jgi:demethylmenaquinone methyltransferase/2-methoxy-6-polyprenyl-1,4-benzoquinol methylase
MIMPEAYDVNAFIYDPLLRRALAPLRRLVAASLAGGKDGRILDLCCGTGEQLHVLRRRDFRSLHGVDLSAGMLAVVRRKDPAIRVYREDAADTSFPDASFDAVLISLALHDKDPRTRSRIFHEMRRLLRPGGTAVVADFCFDENASFGGRFMISAVERIAGGEHYRNFRDYIRQHGLPGILPPEIFTCRETGRAVGNAIGVWELRLPKTKNMSRNT